MEVMQKAKSLDLQDRYVNSKCTKYMLRNDALGLAAETIALFAKDGVPKDSEQDLVDMQCIWYAYEAAEAHQRKLQFGLALKRYSQIVTHFFEFVDDQLDFHAYSIRKQTLRSYIDIVLAYTKLRGHAFYVKAAKGAIRTYLTIYKGGAAAEVMIDGVSLIGMSDSDRKKAISKSKKANMKAKKVDTMEDFGAKFIVGVDHLKEATKLIEPLLKFSSGDLESLELGCLLYLAKRKYLLVLKCILEAAKFPNSRFLVYLYASRLALLLHTDSEIDPIEAKALNETIPTLLKDDLSIAGIEASSLKELDTLDPLIFYAAARLRIIANADAKCSKQLEHPSTKLIDNYTIEVRCKLMNRWAPK